MDLFRARNRGRHRLILIVLMLGIPWSVPLRADEYRTPQEHTDTCDMVVDTVICRPAGLVATAVGTALWVVSLPFSLAGGNEEEARKKLVYEPAAYTFKRPLGSRECSCDDFQDP